MKRSNDRETQKERWTRRKTDREIERHENKVRHTYRHIERQTETQKSKSGLPLYWCHVLPITLEAFLLSSPAHTCHSSPAPNFSEDRQLEIPNCLERLEASIRNPDFELRDQPIARQACQIIPRFPETKQESF